MRCIYVEKPTEVLLSTQRPLVFTTESSTIKDLTFTSGLQNFSSTTVSDLNTSIENVSEEKSSIENTTILAFSSGLQTSPSTTVSDINTSHEYVSQEENMYSNTTLEYLLPQGYNETSTMKIPNKKNSKDSRLEVRCVVFVSVLLVVVLCIAAAYYSKRYFRSRIPIDFPLKKFP